MKTETDETKNENCYHLFNLKSFQTCMKFLLLLNTEEHILKNPDNQSVLVPMVHKMVTETV